MRAFRRIAMHQALSSPSDSAWTIDSLSGITYDQTSTVFSADRGWFCFNYEMNSIYMATGGLGRDQLRGGLSDAKDLTTIGGASEYVSYSSTVGGAYIDQSGTRMYISVGSDLRHYSLTVKDRITTKTLVYTGVGLGSLGLTFSPDGLNMYQGTNLDATVIQRTLSIPWDLSSVSSTKTKNLRSITGQLSSMGVAINSSGTQFISQGTSAIRLFNIPTPFDITSITTQHSSVAVVGNGNITVDRFGGKYIFYHNAFGSPDTMYRYVLP